MGETHKRSGRDGQRMTRIPFGVSRLDAEIGGGAPAGSVVLLAGEAGAGAREFLYTSAVSNGLAGADPELFGLHYGELQPAASLPGEIHYVSFTGSQSQLTEEIAYTMDRDIVEAGLAAVTFEDLASAYFQLSPVPRDWYEGRHRRIEELGQDEERRQSVLEALADYLDANADNNLVVIDSLSDLVSARHEEMRWSDIVLTLKGLRRASRSWEGLLLVHVGLGTLSETQFGDLMAAVDGTMRFEWASGGNERQRTLVVQEFRGVLSQIEAENIVRFETEIHEAGFDVSDVRKIR